MFFFKQKKPELVLLTLIFDMESCLPTVPVHIERFGNNGWISSNGHSYIFKLYKIINWRLKKLI